MKNDKSLFSSIFSYGFGNMLYAAVLMVLVPIYLQKLKIDDYAMLSLFLVSTNIVKILFSFSLSNGLLRGFYDFKTIKERKILTSTSYALLMSIFIILVPVGYAFSDFFSKIVFGGNVPASYFVQLILLSLVQIFIEANQGILRAENKAVSYVVFSIANVMLLSLFNMYVLFMTNYDLSALFNSYIISNSIIAILGFLKVRQYLSFQFSTSHAVYILKYGFPLSLASLLMYFNNYGNRYYLLHLSTKTDIAIFDLAQKITSIAGLLFTVGFMTAFTPYYLRLYNEVSKAQFSIIINKVVSTFATLFLWVGLIIVLLQKYFLLLLAENQYLEAAEIVPLLLISNYLNAIYMIYAMGTNINKDTKIEMYITLIIFIFSIFVNIISIKLFNIYGAVLTQLAANCISILLISWYNVKNFHIKINHGKVILPAIVFSVMVSYKVHFQNYSTTSINYIDLVTSVFILLVYAIMFHSNLKPVYAKIKLSAKLLFNNVA